MAKYIDSGAFQAALVRKQCGKRLRKIRIVKERP